LLYHVHIVGDFLHGQGWCQGNLFPCSSRYGIPRFCMFDEEMSCAYF
jgi:hypothetical protein